MDRPIDPASGRSPDARRARIEAKLRALENRHELRRAARRRLLIGTAVLVQIEQGLLGEAQVRGWLDRSLVRKSDRALFDLPPHRGEG